MGPLGCVVLMHVLLKCYGDTYFYYRTGDGDGDGDGDDDDDDDDGGDGDDGDDDKITLSCTEFGWQIDRDFDNNVDCNFSSETSQMMGPHSEACDYSKWRKEEKFQIQAKSGFYACVRNFSSNFIYPFKPDPHVGDTYIVARHRKLAVHDPPQNVNEESPILLDCAFEEPEPQWPYVVYWLKMSDVSERKISACVDFYSREGQDRDQHCPMDPHLLGRISSTSPGPSGASEPQASEPQASEHPGHISHNVRIDRSRPGDSGIYLCVRYAQRQRPKRKDIRCWAVIRNITITVMSNYAPKPIRKQTGALVAGIIFSVILLAGIVFLARPVMANYQARQVQMKKQRNSNGENGHTDPDCSPYAVGYRQPEPYSVVPIRTQMDSAVGFRQPEPYSVVPIRTQMDSAVSSPAGPSGQTSDMPEPYSVIALNNIA